MKPKMNSVTLSVRLPEDLYRKLEAYREVAGVSIASVIKEALRKELNQLRYNTRWIKKAMKEKLDSE